MHIGIIIRRGQNWNLCLMQGGSDKHHKIPLFAEMV